MKNKNFQKEIVKSNMLIEAKYRLSLIESRIIFLLSSCIKRSDQDFNIYEFKVSDILKEFDMNQGEYKKIKNATYSLLKRAMKIRDVERNEELQISFLSSARYLDRKGIVRLRFDPDLKPYLLHLKRNYTPYQLEDVKRLKSTYSIRFYELLKQYFKIGKRTIDLAELKELLGIGVNDLLF